MGSYWGMPNTCEFVQLSCALKVWTDTWSDSLEVSQRAYVTGGLMMQMKHQSHINQGQIYVQLLGTQFLCTISKVMQYMAWYLGNFIRNQETSIQNVSLILARRSNWCLKVQSEVLHTCLHTEYLYMPSRILTSSITIIGGSWLGSCRQLFDGFAFVLGFILHPHILTRG